VLSILHIFYPLNNVDKMIMFAVICTKKTFSSLFSRTIWVDQYQKGKTILDFNELGVDGGFGMAVTLARLCANNLHFLAPER